MQQSELIDRINELARKQRTDGLTDAEKAEQRALREEYIQGFRQNFQHILDDVVIEESDGSRHPLLRVVPSKR